MKTYSFFHMLLACLVIIGCSKSSDGPIIDDVSDESGVDADYTILLDDGTMLAAQLLNANAEVLTLNPGNTGFMPTALPQLSYRDGDELLLYQEITNCSEEITRYDFNGGSSITSVVLNDPEICDLRAMAVAHSNNLFFIAYMTQGAAMEDVFFVRIIDTDNTGADPIDVPLSERPQQLVFANNRLFILTIDDEITSENTLFVLDIESNTLVNEMNLGFNVKKLLKRSDENLIISYDELHSLLDTSTMNIQFVNYEEGKEPRFSESGFDYFDAEGRLYYLLPTTDATHLNIPAVYDFSVNTAFFYFYENFLPETRIDFDFEVGDTTMISYDEANNIILIGYQKTSDPNKGGLLRIKPAPEAEFIDNTDLDGVPYDIFIN